MLDRKLLRDLAKMKGQAATIALVVASGIGGFIAMLSTYDSLKWSRGVYYDAGRFAQVFVDLKRAPESLSERIARLPGVADAETTVVFDATLDVPGAVEPIIGRMIGLTEGGEPRLNRLSLRRGRWIKPGERSEVLVSEGFANARGLKPGDRLAALLNGNREPLRIVGVVLSPEYIYANRGGALPDDRGFGVFWIDRDGLAAAYNMEGAFNHAALRLAAGDGEDAVIDALDRLLAPYGGLGAYGRDAQISNRILNQEINQQKVMGTIFPSIFLGVAAFLLNVVLGRQVSTQREQIASLKALGYGNGTIAAHYLKLVLIIVLAGIAIGIGIGAGLGRYMTGMYTVFFHFPRLTYRLALWIPLSAAGISLAAGATGAMNAVRRAASLVPAEAMRPPAPARYRRMLLERLGWVRLIAPSARMIIRNLERRPFRSVLTSFGIACSIAVIVGGTFWRDAIDYLIDVQFNASEREDAVVAFAEPVSHRARYEVAHLPGVLWAEGGRDVPVLLRSGHRSYRTAVSGISRDAELRRLLDADLRRVPLPPDGLLLTDRLARRLGVEPGDSVRLESLEGERAQRDVPVSGLVNDLIGLSAYMEIGALNRLMKEGDSLSSVAVSIDVSRIDEFFTKIKEMPKVATVVMKRRSLETFEKESARNILFFTTIVTLFGAVTAIGVVYNNARIALAERAWELASLRVLGFTRREVSLFLLGELAVEVLAAVPLGLWLGYLLAVGMAGTTDAEMFFIPVVIAPRTYAYAALAVLVSGAASALIVRHRIDYLDLVSVLKTRE
jgi:putative ABC transport system permease protein